MAIVVRPHAPCRTSGIRRGTGEQVSTPRGAIKYRQTSSHSVVTLILGLHPLGVQDPLDLDHRHRVVFQHLS
jgi:hypothetical protein